MEYVDHFHVTGNVVGGFKTGNGAVITVVTKSGKDAFIKISTSLEKVPAIRSRVEVEGYVSRRRGHDRNSKAEYFAQCFVAEKVAPAKTLAEKVSGNKGSFYDRPDFICTITGEVIQIKEASGFTDFLVKTRKPNGKSVSIWVSMKTMKSNRGIKVGSNAEFITGVYTGNRMHETLTVRDLCLIKGKEKASIEKDKDKNATEGRIITENRAIEEDKKEEDTSERKTEKDRKFMAESIIL